MKKTILIYSSLTGNTKKIGERIFELLSSDEQSAFCPIEDVTLDIVKRYDRVIFGFWIDKNLVDLKTRNLLEVVKNKEIAFFGTLGADPNSKYGLKIYNMAVSLFSEKNKFLGGFLCRGKVANNNLNESNLHPNEGDLKNAVDFFNLIL